MLNIEHKIKEDTQDFISYKSITYYPIVLSINYGKIHREMPSRLHEYLKFYQSNIVRLFQGDLKLIKIISEGYIDKIFFEKIIKEKIYPFYNLLEDEKYVLKKIINLINNEDLFNKEESELSKLYKKYTTDITDILDREISLRYQQEIREIFTEVINKEYEKRIFNIADFLLHFINWDSSFYYFYDSATEIIPGVIHSIEPRLSYELRTTIRAYRVYFTQINIIKRILDKREKGKIVYITYIDWLEEVKKYLLDSFIINFGERIANEYLTLLEKILIGYLK